jgi:hypothetical protein
MVVLRWLHVEEMRADAEPSWHTRFEVLAPSSRGVVPLAIAPAHMCDDIAVARRPEYLYPHG